MSHEHQHHSHPHQRVCVIVNPAAGRGRGARVLASVRKHFAAVGITDVRTTSAPGDEATVARRAIDEGCSTLVAVGGDGTWSNVAGAILSSASTSSPECRLALVAAGTGNDFAKTVGVPAHDIARMARLSAGGSDLRVDVGRVEQKYFLNLCGFGFDTAVLEDVERIRWLRGTPLYFYSALRQIVSYEGVHIGVGSPNGRRECVPHLMLVVANARHFGGSFRIAPDASLTDGRLDAISIHDAPTLRRLRLFAAAARGTHTREPEVIAEQTPSLTLRFHTPPAYDVDGEYRRAASAEVEVACVPRALRVVVPNGQRDNATA